MEKVDTRIDVFHWTSAFQKLTHYPHYCGFLVQKLPVFATFYTQKSQMAYLGMKQSRTYVYLIIEKRLITRQ